MCMFCRFSLMHPKSIHVYDTIARCRFNAPTSGIQICNEESTKVSSVLNNRIDMVPLQSIIDFKLAKTIKKLNKKITNQNK